MYSFARNSILLSLTLVCLGAASNHTFGDLSRRCISQCLLAVSTNQEQYGCNEPDNLQPSTWANRYLRPIPDIHSVYQQTRDIISSAKSLLDTMVISSHAERNEMNEDNEQEFKCGGSYSNQRNQYEPVLSMLSEDSFDVRRDAKLLRDSLEKKPNITGIIDILTHRHIEQRSEIAEHLKTVYNIDLIAELNRLPEDVKYLLIALMRHLPEFNAHNLYKNWVPHLASESKILLPILSTVSAAEMEVIEEAYRQLKTNIEYEIIVQLQKRLEWNEKEFMDYSLDENTNGETQMKQHGGTHLDYSKDYFYFAEVLHRALAGVEPDIKTIIAILTRRSRDEILEISNTYKFKYNKNLVEALKENLESDSRDVLIALVSPQPDFNKIWLPFMDMPNFIMNMLISSSNVEAETIRKGYKKLFSIFENTLQSMVQYGLMEDNNLDAINALLGGSNSKTWKFNCNRDPKTVAGELHNAKKNQQNLEETLIQIFTSCSRDQRLAVAGSYSDLYGAQLDADLNNEIKDENLQVVIKALLTPFPKCDSLLFYKYLEPLLKHPKPMLNALNEISHKLKDKIDGTYDQLQLAMERQLLINLEHHLWESNITNATYSFIKKVRSVTQHGAVNSDHTGGVRYSNSVNDAIELHRATSYEAIVKVLSDRTVEERVEIVKTYKYMYKMDLASVLISRLKDDDLRDSIVMSLTPVVPIDISALYDKWLGPAISSSNIIRNIKSTYTNDSIKDLNEQLQRNMDEILLPMLLKQHSVSMSDTGIEVLKDNIQGPEKAGKDSETANPSIDEKNQHEAVSNFDAGDSARSLSKALKDNNEKAVTDILIHCNYDERIEIGEAFKHIFGKSSLQNHMSSLPSNLGNSTNFVNLTKALMTQWPELYAQEIHRNSKNAIIDTLVTTSSGFQAAITKAFKKLYRKPELQDVVQKDLPEVPGDFVKFLLEGQHNKDVEFNGKQAEEFIEIFSNFTETSFSSPKEMDHLIGIITSNSDKNLRKMIEQYEMQKNESIETALKRLGTHGVFSNVISAKIRATKSIPKYYARQLYDSMQNGTAADKERAFILIIIGHAGTDLYEIQNAFKSEFKTSLASMIQEQHDVHYGQIYTTIVETSYSGAETIEETRHESQAYDPKLYATILHKAVEAADKNATADILTSCVSTDQRLEVLKTYKDLFGNDLLSEIHIKFGSTSDRSFHDILVAYLTSLPDFESLYSLNNWIPEANRSQVVNELLSSSDTTADIDAIKVAYEDLKLDINSYLLKILQDHLYEGNLEILSNETQVTGSDSSSSVTKDVQDLSKALNVSIVDMKVIREILNNRMYNQRSNISKVLEEMYKTNLYDKSTSNLEEKIRYLYIALLKPFPVIDGHKILDSWIQPPNRLSKILDDVLKSTNIRMKPLNDACTQLKDHIEEKLISTLQRYDTEAFDPDQYASNLHKAIKDGDKSAINTILTHLNRTQRAETSKHYKTTYKKDITAELKSQFSSASDGQYQDITLAFMTDLPAFDVQDFYDRWVPMLKRSNVLNDIVNTFDFDISAIEKAYLQLKLYIEAKLSTILQDRLYEGDSLAANYSLSAENSKETEVVPSGKSFDASKDAQNLYTALYSSPIDMQLLVKMLKQRSGDQHFEIAQAFEKLYNKILVLELDSKLKGNLHDVVLALVTQFPVDVQTLFGIWIPTTSRLSNILNTIAASSSAEIKAFNTEAKGLKVAMEDKLKSTLQQYGNDELRHKEVASIFPAINFDADHQADELFKLMSAAKIDYAAITQLLSGFNNEQRFEIIKSLKLKNGNNVLLEFLFKTTTDPSQDVSIAQLSPLPKFDQQVFYKHWFGANWPQKSKKTHVLLQILNRFSAFEMSNFSELYQQLITIIEYELSRKHSWEDNKVTAVKVNESQATEVGNNFNGENDASVLEGALNGAKINYTAIIDIFVNRNSSHQRLEIAKSFKVKFNKDLVEEFQTRLQGNFRDIVVGLMTPPPEFDKTWLPFSNGTNVVNSFLTSSYSVQMEAINKAYQRLCHVIETQLLIILKSHVWEGNSLQRINSLLKESPGDIKSQLTPKEIDQYAEQFNKVINQPELQQTMINTFKKCNIYDRFQIAKTYKRLYKMELVDELKSKGAPYFYDVMEALLTPFPEFDDNNFLRMLLDKADLETNQLEILKYFSSTEIEAVRVAYKRLRFNIESNLKEFSQNRLWESKNLDQLYAFFKEMRTVTQVYPAKYADELYGKWLSSSSTHHIWATLSSGYMQDLDDACERLKFYIQHRYKLFSSKEYMALKDIDRQSLNQLIGATSIESQQHPNNYTEYATKLHNSINAPTLGATIGEIFNLCSAKDIEEIAKSYKRGYANDLVNDLDAVLPKDYFHDVIIALLKPFPEFNVTTVYKYWSQLWTSTDLLQHKVQSFTAETKTIQQAYTQMRNYITTKLLYILRNGLWESHRFGPISSIIEKMSSGTQIHQHEGASSTVPAGGSFYPGNDALALSNALKGKIVRIRKIVQIIANRSVDQRLEIAKPIKSLVSDFDSKLYGDIHDIIMALMTPYPAVNAQTFFNKWVLPKFRSTNTVNVLATLSVGYIEAFHEASEKLNLYLDTELKKALHDLPNPKCLKIKDSPAVPSIRPADVYDAHKDAKALKEAVKNDKKSIINEILTHRSIAQRLAIAEAFKEDFHENLAKVIEKRFYYRFQEITVSLVTPLPELYAKILEKYSATHLDKPYGIIDFLATSSNANISDIQRAYHELYPKSKLEDIVLRAFEGVAKDMAKDILDRKRNEAEPINEKEVDADATFLFELGENRFFRTAEEEQRVAAIFATRSRGHLRKLIALYENSFKECIEAAIKQRGLHKDLETLVLAIIHTTKSTPEYYAGRLYDTLRGTHVTYDNNLIRIVVGRSEIDLKDIQEAFDRKYKIIGKDVSLIKLIKMQTKDVYFDTVIAILEPKP